ncbi:hypothetical protein PF002_g23122 [Phytophthora fragariae]|uniref:Uncharacterized protein n=1 Tax=Phytophthora fragariae TaxID=53985 RepID=A0A6A3X6H8_9STRA|nr:hypothetical protein PF002_g23122 [Phytophthora fragariae]KAE9225501.1 hypothetical protein PF004_g11924 [Phytophthora fragariae]
MTYNRQAFTLGGEETVFSGVSNSIVEVLAKRIKGSQERSTKMTGERPEDGVNYDGVLS